MFGVAERVVQQRDDQMSNHFEQPTLSILGVVLIW